MSMQYNNTTNKSGFTLIEMMVAVALFSIVMTVSIGSLLSLVDANRRAQGIQSAMNNLDVALDGMVRALRMGSRYKVTNNGHTLTFVPFVNAASGTPWRYTFKEELIKGRQVGRLYKKYKPQGFTGYVDVPLTAPEVDIESFAFVHGKAGQPRILITVKGSSGFEKAKTTTHFNIQASATQRSLKLIAPEVN